MIVSPPVSGLERITTTLICASICWTPKSCGMSQQAESTWGMISEPGSMIRARPMGQTCPLTRSKLAPRNKKAVYEREGSTAFLIAIVLAS